MVLVACSTIIVVGGGWWLVRAPAPPPEATLPFAPTASVAPSGTGGGTPTLAPPNPPDTVAPPTSGPTWVVVHVAGSVTSPGVFRLEAGSRVDDAIRSAGGPTGDADLDGLNLASVLTDAERVYVPHAGEIDPATVPSGITPSRIGQPTNGPVGPVDLNTGDVDDFDELPGVGPATAAAIVQDRERNGPFASVDDLDRVPGIGPAKLDALRDLVSV